VALPLLYLITQADIVDRFGGAEWLTQALDPHQTGTYDTTILDRARADASGNAMSAAGNRVKLWMVDPSAIPQDVIALTAKRAVVYCWDYGTHGKVRPEQVQKYYEETEAAFDRWRKGEAGTGYGEPPVRTGLRPIDNSDCGRRMVYSTFARSGWR